MKISDKITVKCWLAEALIVILALVALRKDNPYGFYVFLRWVACPLFLWVGWKAWSRCFGIPMVIAAGVLALLFNPILRVMLDREKWEILNIAMIAVAVWSAILSIKGDRL